jgi:ubiquitin C-terminal hydrolase
MNATLQCFSNLRRFRTHLLSKEIYQNLEENKFNTKKLSFALAEVLKNLWEKLEQRSYAPENFKKVISEMNPLFKGIAANDPKDLILFVLETMHNEMNNPLNSVIIEKNPNNTNLNEVYNNFENYYTNKNKSIISDEFYGFINYITKCSLCNIEIYDIQSFNILFFHLEEIRNFKYITEQISSIGIIDCFNYNFKNAKYQTFHCNYCKNDCKSILFSNLIKTPKTLIINLNRENGFNANIHFQEILNLRKYISFNDSPFIYELIGVISLLNSNDKIGHFIAFCKNSENCEWYKYDDQLVTKSSFNEVIETGLPYVLFYSYIKS